MAFGLADTAKLAVDLSLKGNFASALATNQRALKGFNSQVDTTGTRAYKAGTQIGTGIKTGALIAASGIAFLGSQVIFGLHSLSQLEDVTAATNAGLKSTKSVAGQTADSIRNLAQKYEDLNATIDDKVIQAGENVLLTFTNVRKQAFEPALKAALDLSVGMKQDLQTSIVQIGKALNDPIKGLTSLSRIGVAFSAGQKTQIKDLIKHNDLLGAQKVILGELSKEFGGRFAAGGKTAAGAIAGIGDAVEELQMALATGLLPVVQKVLPRIRAALGDPKVLATIKGIGDSIASLFTDQNLAEGGRIIGSVFETAKAAAPVLKDTAVAMLGIVKQAVSLFTSLPPDIQKLAVGAFAVNKLTGGLVTNVAGGIVGAILGQLKSAVVNVTGAIVNVGGAGLGAAGGVAGAGRGLLGTAAGLITKVTIVGIAAEAADLIHGAISPGGGLEGRTQTGQLLAGDQLSWPFGPKDTPHLDIGPFKDILGGDSQFIAAPVLAALTKPVPTADNRTPGSILDRGGREAGFSELAGKFKDDIIGLGDLLKGISARFIGALDTLRHSSDPKAVAAAVKDLQEVMVKNGHGSVAQTKETIAALTAQLKKTHDPTLQAALKTAITDLKNKVPGREYAQRELAKADKIIGSNQTNGQKLRELQAIERDLKDHKLPGQTRTLAGKIDALKREQKIAQNSTTQAIKDKDLSLKLSVYTPVRVNINARQVAATNAIFSKYFGGTPTGTRAPRGG
jgi:hypothetical protein